MDSNKRPLVAFEGQQRAINSDAKTVTVSAGAGTGKTWVLSNRYARLLLSSADILPRDILTLTYTEAAAGEMKRRIEDRVIKILETCDDISKERKNAIIDGFGEAWISTIHSFAARIIHESGLALDIDPKAAVISGPQEENFWNGISQAAEFGNLTTLAYAYGNSKLRKLARELDNDKYISAAVGRWGARTLSDLAKNTAELHASLGDNWEHFLACADEEFFIKNARNILRGIMRDYWLDVFNTWGGIFANSGDIITQKAAEGKNTANMLLCECMNYYYECKNNDNINDGTLGNFYNKIVLDKRIKAHGYEPFKSIKAELGMTLGDWRKQFPAINTEAEFSDLEIKFHTALLKFCALSWGLWDNMKRRRGLLSFSDMILHAMDAIREKRGADTDSYDNIKKFKYILVDEFQDTDPLQFNLIQAAAAQSANSPYENSDTGLFAVGDPKQSIYGFRHAEPELFAKMMNANLNPDLNLNSNLNSNSNIELDVSFRTRPELLERINDLFSHIWEKGLGSSDAMRLLKFKTLQPARTSWGSIPPFSLIIYDKRADLRAMQIDEIRALLARELARKILYWVNNGYTVWDKGTDELRPVKFSDFAILLRGRKPYDVLEGIFTDEGVPSVQDLSKNYFSRGEVGDIINLLRACADKNDSASVTGWLMSPFSGVTRDDALKLVERAAAENLNIYELLPHDETKRLERLAQTGLREGPAELIAIFDRDRRWLEDYRQDERLRVIRNVRSAMALAHSFQGQSGASSLTACADWMIQAMRHGVNMEEPSWHDPEDNSVLFTTIHKSKGLEYPVTIIFDTSDRYGGGKSALRPSRELGVVFSGLPDELQDNTGANCCAAWDRFLSERGEYEEDMRLFYVAATRAQDALIICGIAGSSKSGESSRNSWTDIVLKRMIERGECGLDLTSPIITPVGVKLNDDLKLNNLNKLENQEIKAEKNALTQEQKQETEQKKEQEKEKKEKKEKNENDVCVNVKLQDKNDLSLNELSATSFAMYEWCPAAWRMRYRQGIDLKYAAVNGINNNINAVGGADVGSLAHWALSKNFSGAYKFFTGLARDDIPIYLRSVWDNEPSRDATAEILKNFEESDAYFIIQKAMLGRAKNNFSCEAKFRVNLDNIILTGAMDIIWRDGGTWHVMDYKTGLKDNAPDELYRSQLDFYALVLRESAKLNNDIFSSVEAGIIYLREGGRIESWSASGWDDLRRRVINAAHGAISGDFQRPEASSRCEACPWRFKCVLK